MSTENDIQLKNKQRKDIRNSLKDTLGDLLVPEQDFNLMVKQLDHLDLTRSNISHQTRSNIEKNILKNSPMYPEILDMMRKKKDKKKIAALIKKALEAEGYKTEDITALRDKALGSNPVYQVMDISKTETQKVLMRMLQRKPLWTKYLQDVTGISVLTGSKLLHHINDVTRFSQPSKLIKYCGLAVDDDGVADRMKAGETGSYNPNIKALLLGVIGDNFIKSNSEYRRVYDERAEHTKQTNPVWWNLDEEGEKLKGKNMHPKHGYRDAVRCMAKRFLHEFWDNGWLLSGVQPPSKPYAVAILGHDMEPKIVPVNSGRGLVYSWSDAGVLDKDRRILYDWGEWQSYVDSLTEETI